MRKKQFIHLLKKYLNGKATEEESRFIESYYDLFETDTDLEEWLNQEERNKLKKEIQQNISRNIQEGETKRRKTRKILPLTRKIAAAVAILLVSGITFYLVYNRMKKPQPVAKVEEQHQDRNDIQPGGNKAILTLANGKQIILDSTDNGLLSMQGGTKIVKLNNGLLTYNSRQTADNGQPTTDNRQPIRYNTITTPAGGKYEIVLPDGTKAWLNAKSSIRFPMAFTGKMRKIEMTGEVYFEVAQQRSKPFIVGVGDLKVKVLGTHFNVNAYGDESTIKTTLVQGAVKVINGHKAEILRPGQQAVWDKENGKMRIKNVDVKEYLAWKNGLFYFDNTNIKTIMRQIARWYDVEVKYANQSISNKRFSGVMSRYSEVSALLKRMELTGTIQFDIEGKIITVKN